MEFTKRENEIIIKALSRQAKYHRERAHKLQFGIEFDEGLLKRQNYKTSGYNSVEDFIEHVESNKVYLSQHEQAEAEINELIEKLKK